MARRKLSKFSERLLVCMKENKMTQKQLAEHLLTTQQTVSRWIQGETEPDFDTMLRICFYLGEEPGFILGFDKLTPSRMAAYQERLRLSLEKKLAAKNKNKV